HALRYADEILKADREIVLAAVSKYGPALEYADKILKADREIVLAAVSKDGRALEYADEILKADREVVLVAVSNNGDALEYADEILQADREVVLAAVSKDGRALEYADEILKADREVILEALYENIGALHFANVDEYLLEPVLESVFGFYDIEGFGDPDVMSDGTEKLLDYVNDFYNIRSMASGESEFVEGECVEENIFIKCWHAIEVLNVENYAISLKFFTINYDNIHDESDSWFIAYYERFDLNTGEIIEQKVRFADGESIEEIDHHNEFLSELITRVECPIDEGGDEDEDDDDEKLGN
ncbi:MAG: DUF4116 domain-containing protein, partial [Methylococcaceae bacterium]